MQTEFNINEIDKIESLYEKVLKEMPLLVRNEIPSVVYENFCKIRETACKSVFDSLKGNLPPMSDVLTTGDKIRITVEKSSSKPLYVENLRQKSAYLFDGAVRQMTCRGAVVEENGSSKLQTAATMSMVDETVLFPNDAYEQLYKSMENLRWLLGQFNLKKYGLQYGFAVDDICQLRVYFKNDADLDFLKQMTPRFVSRECQFEYIRSGMPYDGVVLALEAVCYKKGFSENGEKYKVVEGRIRTESFELHVCEHCNLRCNQCCNLSPFHKEHFMSIEETERICDFLEKHIAPDVIKVAGGEPLLHPQLAQILKIIKQRFPQTNLRIVTNGVLANRYLTEEIMSTIDQLWISNYRNVAVPENTVARIKQMAKDNFVLLNIKDVDQFYNIVLTEKNEDESRVRSIYDNCWMKHRCLMVRKNTFFKCTRAAYIEDQQYIYDMPTNVKAADEGINIDDPDFQQKALHYLNDKEGLESCSYCLGVSGTLFDIRQMKKEEVQSKML